MKRRPVRRGDVRIRGEITSTIPLTPASVKVVGTSSGYVWIGTESQCFGYIEDLRTIRALHARLGALIARRERKTAKKRSEKTR